MSLNIHDQVFNLHYKYYIKILGEISQINLDQERMLLVKDKRIKMAHKNKEKCLSGVGKKSFIGATIRQEISVQKLVIFGLGPIPFWHNAIYSILATFFLHYFHFIFPSKTLDPHN